MKNNFSDEVQSIVGPLLSDLDFTLDEVDDHVDEGGRSGSVVYYRAKDCKVQVYRSPRQGSINCMIASRDAPNIFGPQDQSLMWQYLTKFSKVPELPIEQLLESVSFEPKSTAEELEWVRDNIAKYYQDAHRGIVEMR